MVSNDTARGNVKISYQYRDGNNYKNGGSVVALNPEGRDLSEADEFLRSVLDEGEYFIARQVDFPDVFLYLERYRFDPDADHCWHEYQGMEWTDEPVNDSRTLSQILGAFNSASSVDGWLEYSPDDEADVFIVS